MWRIRHIAIRLDLVDEIDVLRIFQKAAKEKHDIADKKSEEGVEDPNPYVRRIAHTTYETIQAIY
jgi:hypothetical protein